VHKTGTDPNRDYYSELVKKNQQNPQDQMDEFEDAKVAGSHHCETSVSHLKCQGNQWRP